MVLQCSEIWSWEKFAEVIMSSVLVLILISSTDINNSLL